LKPAGRLFEDLPLDPNAKACELTEEVAVAARFRDSLDAVLLDAAGTLIRPSAPVGETYAAAARRFGMQIDPDELSHAFIRVFGDMPALAFDWTSMEDLRQQERVWWRSLVHRVITQTGNNVGDFDGFFDTLYRHYAQGRAWERFPDVLPALRSLQAKGCKLAVVSNFDSRLPEILRELGIEDLLDAVIYSSRAGSAKPDPAIFQRALDELGVTPQRTVHVGDSLEADVAGAAAAGIRGLLIRRRPMPAGESVIASLQELLE